MIKRVKISEVQARQIALEWAKSGIQIGVDPESWITPTNKALLKKGLIEPTGMRGTWTSGRAFELHRVNAAGLLALEGFLFDLRMKTERTKR